MTQIKDEDNINQEEQTNDDIQNNEELNTILESCEAEINDINEQKELEENQVVVLQQELKKFQEIASQSQSQYMNLKYDFDSLLRRVEREKIENSVKSIIESVSNFLPFIENLRISIQSIPNDIQDNNWVKGIALLYATLIKKLEEMWVYEIDCIWLEPDTLCHEPISTQPIEDDNLKWKIVQECERWFIYKKWDTKIVIKPSRVIVWS